MDGRHTAVVCAMVLVLAVSLGGVAGAADDSTASVTDGDSITDDRVADEVGNLTEATVSEGEGLAVEVAASDSGDAVDDARIDLSAEPAIDENLTAGSVDDLQVNGVIDAGGAVVVLLDRGGVVRQSASHAPAVPPATTASADTGGPDVQGPGAGAGPDDGDTGQGDGAPAQAGSGDRSDGTTAEPVGGHTDSDGRADESAAGATSTDGVAASRASIGFPGGDGLGEFALPVGVGLLLALAKPLAASATVTSALLTEWFGRVGVLLRYSRRDGSDPLEHDTRARIDDIVADEPGLPLSDLAARLDTPLSTVRHHVRVLEREGVLTTRKQRGNRRLYPLDVDDEALVAALDSDSTAAIIESLRRRGRATVGDIVDDVDRTYSTVSHHLSRLVEEGLVRQEKDGRSRITELDPAVKRRLEGEGEPATADPTPQRASAD